VSIIARLGKNLQFSFYQRIISTLSYLFLVPFILDNVDHSLYGLNILLLSLLGYFKVADIGMQAGISRFSAKFIGEGKNDELNDLLNIGVKIYFLIGIVASISFFSLSYFYHDVFSVNEEIIQKGKTLFYIYAFSSFFIIFNAPFKGVLSGAQRQDITSKVEIIISLCKILLAIIILTYYKSYLTYVFFFQLFTILFITLNIYNVFKIFPCKLRLSNISRTVFKQVVGFSGLMFLSGLFGIAIYQVDNIVIGRFISLGAITMYSIAFIIHQQISSLNSLLCGPLFYIFSTEFAKGYNERSKNMVMDAVHMHIGIMLPILIIVIINVDHFILAWVGDNFNDAILPARILLSYWFLTIIYSLLIDAAIGGLGKVKEIVIITGFVAVANLVLSIILVKHMGIVGVAIGTSIPYLVVAPFYIIRLCRLFSIKISSFIIKAIIPNIPHVLLSVVLATAIHILMRKPNLFEVLVLFGACYGIIMLFGYVLLSESKKNVVRKIIRPVM
jgi:O-antigen/teichoic acid export membrane protein